MKYAEIEKCLNLEHLRCCGGFHPNSTDKLGQLNETISTAIIVGNAGNQTSFDFWAAFQAGPHHKENPLETWTRDILSEIATELAADVLYPFDGPPYIPILTWAERAEPVHQTPFGPLIHPEYGLWHAYRGVLLFKETIEIPPFHNSASPCIDCKDQPCLSACPVNAIADRDFNIEACAGFLASDQGNTCSKEGCLARRACPIGQDHIYEPAQAAFHLQAFLETYGP